MNPLSDWTCYNNSFSKVEYLIFLSDFNLTIIFNSNKVTLPSKAWVQTGSAKIKIYSVKKSYTENETHYTLLKRVESANLNFYFFCCLNPLSRRYFKLPLKKF